jgi:hypothetical protein
MVKGINEVRFDRGLVTCWKFEEMKVEERFNP